MQGICPSDTCNRMRGSTLFRAGSGSRAYVYWKNDNAVAWWKVDFLPALNEHRSPTHLHRLTPIEGVKKGATVATVISSVPYSSNINANQYDTPSSLKWLESRGTPMQRQRKHRKMFYHVPPRINSMVFLETWKAQSSLSVSWTRTWLENK